MKNQLRLLLVLSASCLACALAGCETHSYYHIQQVKNGVTNDIVKIHSASDPLLAKVVEQDDHGYGLDFNFMGSSSYSPFHIKVGIFDTTYRSVPTSTNFVYSAPYNATMHRNYSLIQQAADENVTTSSNGLPANAYIGPNVSTLNPIVGNPTTAGASTTTATTNAK